MAEPGSIPVPSMPKTSPSIEHTPAAYRRMRDPALLRFYYSIKAMKMLDAMELSGSSPPDIFVGRIGYPKVFIGPLVPPLEGDTSLLGTPEMWPGRSIADIVEMRSQLLRGMYAVNVRDVNRSGIVDFTQELALSKDSAYVDLELEKKPRHVVRWDDHTQPFGPSAPLKSVQVSGTRADTKIEKAHSDTDLKAADAIIELYEKGVLVSKIQKAFSAGLFGLKNRRRFVPTRWAITAVDDAIGKHLLAQVKEFPTIDEFRVYETVALDNRWEVLMMPRHWSYELMEAWYPGTVWNATGRCVEMYSSAEGWLPRKRYAEIGGCYYAARLAVCELLVRLKRQATVIILREAHPGYIMPVGVWNVREHVRQALRSEPLKFDTLAGALRHVQSRLEIPLKVWMENSRLFRALSAQKALAEATNLGSLKHAAD
ncbi:MAG: Nre family DNA repair protein [Candidatus Aenigmatarchaeota archaeon]